MVKVGQHMPGEQVGFGGMRVAGQDESLHAEVSVGTDLGEHLIGITDDGRSGARARTADASPQVRFGVAVVIGDVAELVLPLVPAELVSRDRRRMVSPVRSSSRETRRCAAARASASVARTMTWAR